MHRRKRTHALRAHVALAIVSLASAAAVAVAQDRGATPGAMTLKQSFAAAWARQPEAQALQARRESARAAQDSARLWTPEPVALELAHKTDRLNRNQGTREFEFGMALPLWLPGERARSGALADAEANAIDSRVVAAQLRLAGTLREAWWQWQRARIDADVAGAQLANARRLAADVAKRLKAGDMARADQHQADGAVAAAEAALAQATGTSASAELMLRALVGPLWGAAPQTLPPVGAEPDPADTAAVADPAAHPGVIELERRAAVAGHALALASVQTRGNPELTLATTRERGSVGESYNQTLTLALRIPFGAGSRQVAKTATARAEAVELQAQLALERDRVVSEREAARLRVSSARLQLDAAQRRTQLAGESRGFFEKSFRLGETDLPTRLRIEFEAAEAERQLARSRIELAAAISQWRQALGLLPE